MFSGRTGDFDEKFIRYAQLESGKFNRDQKKYFQGLQESDAKVDGEQIKSYFHPFILSQKEYDDIKKKVEMMAAIIDKSGKLFLEDAEVQENYGFDSRLQQLMEVDPGYHRLIPVARYDAFYNPEKEQLRFCEFNADGSSGMNETNTLEELFLGTETGGVFRERYNLFHCELRKSLLNALILNYREFAGRSNQVPRIAIVDWEDVGTVHEFRALQKTFINEGYPTIICDPRKLRFCGGRLWFEDLAIDLVYRRVVTTELLAMWEEVQDFIKAYQAGAFCLVGSFRTEVAHSKLIYCLLSNPAYRSYFSLEEQEFLSGHIPWTRRLISEPDFLQKILRRQENLVLKPHNSYGSKGVYLGRECTVSQWQELVYNLAGQNYLVQEKLPMPEKEFLVDQKLETKRLKVNISTFLYNNQLTGFYTRVSPNEIITTSCGAALVPTLISRGENTWSYSLE